MTIEKISGSSDGRIIKIGGTHFAMLPSYMGTQGNSILGEWCGVFRPYAFYKDGEWTISESPRHKHKHNEKGYRWGYIGIMLNSIDRDKSKRLPYHQFLDLFEDAYREALQDEINVFSAEIQNIKGQTHE